MSIKGQNGVVVPHNYTLVSLIQKSSTKVLIDRVKAANLERDLIKPLVIDGAASHSRPLRAIAEDLVRQAVPFDTPDRRAIVEDARRAAFRPTDDPGVISRFVA